MIWRTISALAITILSVAALSGCGQRSETFRYRMAVEIETPQGLRTGSSVIEVRVTETGDNAPVFPEASGVSSRVRGEAVVVDLPNGKVLFALLRAPGHVGDAAGLPYAALDPPRPKGNYDFVRQTQAMQKMERVAVLPRTLPPLAHLPERSAYPTLVTFGDIADPTSVELVDPDNLAATFGEGTALRRITIKITDDPVTTGIEERLEWLEHQAGTLVRRPRDTPIGNMPIEHRITEGAFWKGAS